MCDLFNGFTFLFWSALHKNKDLPWKSALFEAESGTGTPKVPTPAEIEHRKPQNSHMDVSKNGGTPKWMVKIMENPIEMDDLGVPLFLETPIFQGGYLC